MANLPFVGGRGREIQPPEACPHPFPFDPAPNGTQALARGLAKVLYGGYTGLRKAKAHSRAYPAQIVQGEAVQGTGEVRLVQKDEPVWFLHIARGFGQVQVGGDADRTAHGGANPGRYRLFGPHGGGSGEVWGLPVGRQGGGNLINGVDLVDVNSLLKGRKQLAVDLDVFGWPGLNEGNCRAETAGIPDQCACAHPCRLGLVGCCDATACVRHHRHYPDRTSTELRTK
jgi:hypothetical protein